MVTDTVVLKKGSTDTIEIQMTFIGLLQTEYTAKLSRFLTRIKEESGLFPDAEPDVFKLPSNENENIGRKFELDTTLGGVDPINYPAWEIICRVVRKGTSNDVLKTVTDSGTFSNNLADSKIIIYLSGV